jgi:hypothetical protein
MILENNKMKKYYALIISVLSILAGSTGCFHAATDYGVPVVPDENLTFDEDFEETEADDVQNADSDLN